MLSLLAYFTNKLRVILFKFVSLASTLRWIVKTSTGDEKLIDHNNVVLKRPSSKRDKPPQTTSRAELHQEKIMLSV